MPCIFFGEMFASENMPQVGTAVITLNLRSHAVRVWKVLNSAGDFVVEAWPTTVCLKLVF